MKKKIIAPWLFAGIMVISTACGSTKEAVTAVDSAGVGKTLEIEVEGTTIPKMLDGEQRKLVPKVHATEEFDAYTEAETEGTEVVNIDPEFLVDSIDIDWYAVDPKADYTIVLDGDAYTLPMQMSELLANGWEVCDGYEDEALPPGEFYNCDIKRGNKKIGIGIENLYTTEQQALSCDVWKIIAVWGNWFDEDEVYTLELPKYNVALGEPAPDTIDNPSYFGEGMEFDSSDYANHWWETIGGDGFNSHVEVGRFMISVDEDGMVSGITVSCTAKGADYTGERE